MASAAPQPWYMPVVEVATVPELSMAFPQGAPVVHLISSPVVLQEKEAVHLVPDEDTNMPEGVTLEVSAVTPVKLGAQAGCNAVSVNKIALDSDVQVLHCRCQNCAMTLQFSTSCTFVE